MYRGFYINLDRSVERREFTEQHLRALGVAERYERFAAVDGAAARATLPTPLADGYLGVWLSVQRVLAEAARETSAAIHVLEDDAMLCRDFAAIIDALVGPAGQPGALARFDVIFTDVAIAPETRLFLELSRHAEEARRLGGADACATLAGADVGGGSSAVAAGAGTFGSGVSGGVQGSVNGGAGSGPGAGAVASRPVHLMPLRGVEWAGMTSFLVGPAAVGRLAGLMADKWRLGVPVDLFVRDLIDRGKLSAAVTVPFLSTLSPHSTTSAIRGPQDDARRVMDLFRRGFFIDADPAALLAEMRRLTADARTSERVELFLAASRYAMSDRWKPF